MNMLEVPISFEFFPPKSEAMAEVLLASAEDLKRLSPEFVTVTFGVSGSTKFGTYETALMLKEKLGYSVGAHISYFGLKKVELNEYADLLWAEGIHHLVALRGDIPYEVDIKQFQNEDYFQFTSDFVEALLNAWPFDISVGAYPEKHPDAPDMAADIRALKLKCGAGARRAITQFFFETAVYENFLKQVRAVGIQTPIVPGLLPISDVTKIKAFSAKCGSHIPDYLEKRLLDSPDSLQESIDYLASQIDDLISLNVPQIHFYTLNRADIILSAFRKLGYL